MKQGICPKCLSLFIKPRPITKYCSKECRYKSLSDMFSNRNFTGKTLTERFYSFVNKSGEECCWLWLGGVNGKGYGNFSDNGRSRTASRVSYELANGKVPSGMQILHHCDTPLCVNPRHLYAGTNKQNMTDKMTRNRFNPVRNEWGQFSLIVPTASRRRAICECVAKMPKEAA